MRDIFNTLFRYKDKKSPDKLGLYPIAVHIASMPERRYLWTSRILVILACISISFNMMLASGIYLLLPQRGAIPQLLYTDKDFSKLEKMQPNERNISADNLIIEQIIEKYIRLRHEITFDPLKLADRWSKNSEFYWLSAPMNYQDFTNKYKDNVYTYIANFETKFRRREVKVQWIRHLSGEIWQAQFEIKNFLLNSDEPQTAMWRAYLRIREFEIDFENKPAIIGNPFGIRVQNYSLAYFGTDQKSEDYLSLARKVAETTPAEEEQQ